MRVHGDEQHGAVGDHDVEIGAMRAGDAGGVQRGVQDARKAKAEDDWFVWVRIGVALERRLHVGDGLRTDHLQLGGEQACHRRMGVALDEAGQQHPALQVDDASVRAGCRLGWARLADVGDAAVAHQHGFGDGLGVVRRPHGAVDEQRLAGVAGDCRGG